MKTRSALLLTIAVICFATGAVAGFAVARLAGPPTKTDPVPRQAPTEPEFVEILVARDNILEGTLLGEPEELFEVRKYRKEDIPAGAKLPADKESIKYRRVRHGVPARLPLTDGHLGRPVVPVVLLDGHRALAVPVHAAQGTIDVIQPATRVDVIGIVQEGDNVRSVTILQNIVVLAVNPREHPEEVPNTVILAVRPEDAERLALGVTQGKLMLTVRKPGDEEQAKATGAKFPP